jgi:hypothetical protein
LVSPEDIIKVAQLLFLNPLFDLFFAIFLVWLVWVATFRPTCKSEKLLEHYIDDSKIRKVEATECEFSWGSRWFYFRKCKIKDIPASSLIAIRFIPQGGIETDLAEEYYDDTPIKNKIYRPLKLRGRSFFVKNAIGKVTVIVQTPFERDEYASKVKSELNGNILSIWNDSSEEIRNFEYLLTRSSKMKNVHVIQGSIKSIELSIIYPPSSSLISTAVGDIETDVAMSLVLDLPPRKIDGPEITKIKLV